MDEKTRRRKLLSLTGISANQRLLLLAIDMDSDADGVCRASPNQLRNAAGIDNVSSEIHGLIYCGLLEPIFDWPDGVAINWDHIDENYCCDCELWPCQCVDAFGVSLAEDG